MVRMAEEHLRTAEGLGFLQRYHDDDKNDENEYDVDAEYGEDDEDRDEHLRTTEGLGFLEHYHEQGDDEEKEDDDQDEDDDDQDEEDDEHVKEENTDRSLPILN